MKVRDIALARSGDQGNRATISVIARDPANYPLLERGLTPERVRALYSGLVHGPVQRYTFPELGAVHFVLNDALAGGVTRSRQSPRPTVPPARRAAAAVTGPSGGGGWTRAGGRRPCGG